MLTIYIILLPCMGGEGGRSAVVRSSAVRLRVKGGDEDLVPPVGQSQLGMAPVR